MKMFARLLMFFCVLALLTSVANASNIKVNISRESFNPILHEFVEVKVSVAEPGDVRLSILDRDGMSVRAFTKNVPHSGEVIFTFDGKDDAGEILPAEAYTPKVELKTASGVKVYDPAQNFHPVLEEIKEGVFSRAYGTITYQVSRTSRVHLQVGTAIIDSKTGKPDGPVLHTVVDRKPRLAGTAVEAFDGFSTDGRVFIPDLPHFAIGIVATSLPPDTILVLGNGESAFTQYALAHEPAKRISPKKVPSSHSMHHEGLSSLEDSSPDLSLHCNGKWDSSKNAWVVRGKQRVKIEINRNDTTNYFLALPGELSLFLDTRLLFQTKKPADPFQTTLDFDSMPSGEHVLSANWSSAYGPVGVGAVRIITGK